MTRANEAIEYGTCPASGQPVQTKVVDVPGTYARNTDHVYEMDADCTCPGWLTARDPSGRLVNLAAVLKEALRTGERAAQTACTTTHIVVCPTLCVR